MYVKLGLKPAARMLDGCYSYRVVLLSLSNLQLIVYYRTLWQSTNNHTA